MHVPGMELPDDKPAPRADQALEAIDVQHHTVTVPAHGATGPTQVAAASAALSPKMSAMSGINLLLSLSSLLFVAAGIAFIASPFSDSGKLFALIAIVALFYGGGIALHQTIARLRPAAVSFVGTGLALIPFLGIAFVQYTSMSVTAVWLLVSAIGLVAYIAAAYVLQSNVVSYLSAAFLLSLASSAVANAALPVVWQFTTFIALSLLASVVAHAKPKWLPPLFTQPVVQTGNIVTPVAAFMSLFWLGRLTTSNYELIFCLTTLQYVVAWLQTRTVWHEQAARALAHLTLLIFVWDIAGGFTDLFGIGFLATAVLQHAYSLIRWARTTRQDIEHNWIWTMLVCQALAMLWWPDKWLWVVATVVVLVMSSCSFVMSKRSSFGAATLYALVVLPFLSGLIAAEPRWPYGGVALWYAVMAAGSMVALYGLRTKLDQTLAMIVRVGFWLFAAAAFALAFCESTNAASISLLVAVVVMMFGMSYVSAQPKIITIVVALVPLVFARFCADGVQSGHVALIIFAGAALTLYAIAAILLFLRDRLRGNIALVAGHAYLLPTLLVGAPLALAPLVTGQQIALAAVLVAGAYAFWLAARFDTAAPTRQAFHRVFCVLYYAFGLYGSLQLPAWWLAFAILVGVILLWEASYYYASAALSGFANVGAAWMLWVIFHATPQSDFPAALWTFAAAMLAFYGAMLAFRAMNDEPRRQIMLWSAWIASIACFMAGYTAPGYGVMASVLLIGGAASMIQEGWRAKYQSLVELGAYISAFGVCQIIGDIAPQTPTVFYAHVAAIAVAVVAVTYNSAIRYQIAAGILTLFVGTVALSEGGWYSLLFLTEQVALSIIGATAKLRWATWWGIAGAVCAVFYYLRESPFLIFTLLGLLIVAFVIMRLSRKTDS